MIIQRMTIRVKPGCMKEWIEVLKTSTSKAPNPEFSRLYVSHADPELLVHDLEFESLADKDKFWEEWTGRPEDEAIRKASLELVDEWVSTEYWTLE